MVGAGGFCWVLVIFCGYKVREMGAFWAVLRTGDFCGAFRVWEEVWEIITR